jgi:hypothetical protein
MMFFLGDDFEQRYRHCARSEASQIDAAVLDCFVASLLAMTNLVELISWLHTSGLKIVGACRHRLGR